MLNTMLFSHTDDENRLLNRYIGHVIFMLPDISNERLRNLQEIHWLH